MVFSSLIFLFLFLPLCIFCYFLIPAKYISTRNIILLIFSLLFYFYGEPKLIIIMLLSIFMNYIFGLLMQNKYRKMFLILCIICNLAIITIYKYLDFFILNINSLFKTNITFVNLIMPIGISFFTFQSLSYVVDVYRKEVKIQKNIINLGLYISMFPQLIAGPIVRYKDINLLLGNRKITTENISYGIDRFIYGLAKKVLLSNTFALIADEVFTYKTNDLSFFLAWFGAIAYTLQIYFDFSGYSDMAIGLGKIFGFDFLENFNYPYISKSITEFWRRWHISLSTWFKDYLYIPLGGNRCSFKRNILNIFVVWMLTGLWHGANFTFITWGIYFAILLIIEKLFLLEKQKKIPNFINHIYTLFFIIIGWVLFRSENLEYAFSYIKVMLIPTFDIDIKVIEYILQYKIQIIFGLILSTPIFMRLYNNKYFKFINIFILLILFLLVLLSLVNNSYNPFIYFRF